METETQLNLEGLPEAVQLLIEVVGEEAAISLMHRYGGIGIWVPVKFAEDHPLAIQIGQDALVKLIAYSGGGFLQIPCPSQFLRQARNQMILKDRARLTVVQIAQKWGLSEPSVWRICAKFKPEKPPT